MSTIRRRLDDLQAARARQEQRKGGSTVVDDVRAMLETVDGQADLDMRPGESLFDVCARRLQSADGWNLDLIPGDTLAAKFKAIDDPAAAIPDEARHAARHWFEMVEGV